MRPSRRQTLPFTRRWSGGRFGATSVLVAFQAAVYTAQFVFENLSSDRVWNGAWLQQVLALSSPGVAAGRYWEFATFMLLSAGPLHAVANLLILHFAGREVEPIVGSRHLCALYFLGNFGGALLHYFAFPAVPLLGISAGVTAVLVAFTTILPELEVTLNLFFVLPLRLRAKHLAVALVGVCAALCFAHSSLEIGPAGMLAAAVLGWFYARQLGFGNPLFFQRFLFERRQRAARLERMTSDQFISAEIDPLLEKISVAGMHSLSRAERRILEKGREKIAAKTALK